MHARTQELANYLDSNHAAFQRAVNDVPMALRERSPSPDSWSVAQIVQHLATVENRVATLLGEQLATTRASGLGPEHDTSTAIDPENVARMTDRSRHMTSPGPAQPAPVVQCDVALASYESARQKLRSVLLGSDGLAVGQISHPHPLFGPLNFYGWMTFIGAHEARHTAQIRETAQELER